MKKKPKYRVVNDRKPLESSGELVPIPITHQTRRAIGVQCPRCNGTLVAPVPEHAAAAYEAGREVRLRCQCGGQFVTKMRRIVVVR